MANAQHDSNSPVNRWFQAFIALVRPGGKVEAYVPWKKEGSDKPVKEVKPIRDGHYAVKANGSTPDLMLKGMIEAAALYFARSGGQETGPASDDVKARVQKIADDLLRPEGAQERLFKDMAFLIAAAPPQQGSTLLNIEGGTGEGWKVKISSRDPFNLQRFLADLKPGTRCSIVDGKTKEETPARAYLKAALKAAEEEEEQESKPAKTGTNG